MCHAEDPDGFGVPPDVFEWDCHSEQEKIRNGFQCADGAQAVQRVVEFEHGAWNPVQLGGEGKLLSGAGAPQKKHLRW